MEYIPLILLSFLFGAILIPGYEFSARLVERTKISKQEKFFRKLTLGVAFWVLYGTVSFIVPDAYQNIMGLEKITTPNVWILFYFISFLFSGIFTHKYLLKPWLNKNYPPIRRGLKTGEKKYQGTVYDRSHHDFCGYGLTIRINGIDADCSVFAVPQGIFAGSFDEYPTVGQRVILYAKETHRPDVKALTGVFSEYSQEEA